MDIVNGAFAVVVGALDVVPLSVVTFGEVTGTSVLVAGASGVVAGFSEVFTRRGVVVLGAFEVVGAAPTND